MAWTYEELFNTLNTGDLNGQDGWSGIAEYDVSTDAAARYEGAKGVKAVTANVGGRIIDKFITPVTDGVMYISMKLGGAATNQQAMLYADSGVTLVCFIAMSVGGEVGFYHTDGNTWEKLADSAADTWFRIGIEFNCATDQMRCNVNNGTWSGWKPFYVGDTVTSVDKIEFNARNGTFYFDTISPNYAPVAEGKPSRLASQMVG